MSAKDEIVESELIYAWTAVETAHPISKGRKFKFMCETLRDGIQSPSVVDPEVSDKIRMVELASDLGIDHIDVGLPGAGARAVEIFLEAPIPSVWGYRRIWRSDGDRDLGGCA